MRILHAQNVKACKHVDVVSHAKAGIWSAHIFGFYLANRRSSRDSLESYLTVWSWHPFFGKVVSELSSKWEKVIILDGFFHVFPTSEDPEVVLEAVKNSGWALEFASDSLRNAPAVVAEAVRFNPWALELAEKLQQNYVLTWEKQPTKGVESKLPLTWAALKLWVRKLSIKLIKPPKVWGVEEAARELCLIRDLGINFRFDILGKTSNRSFHWFEFPSFEFIWGLST